MKLKFGEKRRDPAVTKAANQSKEYLYPEPNNSLPNSYEVSDLTLPGTYSSAPKRQQNREIESEYADMKNMFYNNVDPRRKQELSDARMIQEDHNAMSNLSETPIHHTFNPDQFPERLAMYNQSTKTKR